MASTPSSQRDNKNKKNTNNYGSSSEDNEERQSRGNARKHNGDQQHTGGKDDINFDQLRKEMNFYDTDDPDINAANSIDDIDVFSDLIEDPARERKGRDNAAASREKKRPQNNNLKPVITYAQTAKTNNHFMRSGRETLLGTGGGEQADDEEEDYEGVGNQQKTEGRVPGGGAAAKVNVTEKLRFSEDLALRGRGTTQAQYLEDQKMQIEGESQEEQFTEDDDEEAILQPVQDGQFFSIIAHRGEQPVWRMSDYFLPASRRVKKLYDKQVGRFTDRLSRLRERYEQHRERYCDFRHVYDLWQKTRHMPDQMSFADGEDTVTMRRRGVNLLLQQQSQLLQAPLQQRMTVREEELSRLVREREHSKEEFFLYQLRAKQQIPEPVSVIYNTINQIEFYESLKRDALRHVQQEIFDKDDDDDDNDAVQKNQQDNPLAETLCIPNAYKDPATTQQLQIQQPQKNGQQAHQNIEAMNHKNDQELPAKPSAQSDQVHKYENLGHGPVNGHHKQQNDSSRGEKYIENIEKPENALQQLVQMLERRKEEVGSEEQEKRNQQQYQQPDNKMDIETQEDCGRAAVDCEVSTLNLCHQQEAQTQDVGTSAELLQNSFVQQKKEEVQESENGMQEPSQNLENSAVAGQNKQATEDALDFQEHQEQDQQGQKKQLLQQQQQKEEEEEEDDIFQPLAQRNEKKRLLDLRNKYLSDEENYQRSEIASFFVKRRCDRRAPGYGEFADMLYAQQVYRSDEGALFSLKGTTLAQKRERVFDEFNYYNQELLSCAWKKSKAELNRVEIDLTNKHFFLEKLSFLQLNNRSLSILKKKFYEQAIAQENELAANAEGDGTPLPRVMEAQDEQQSQCKIITSLRHPTPIFLIKTRNYSLAEERQVSLQVLLMPVETDRVNFGRGATTMRFLCIRLPEETEIRLVY